MLDLTIHPLREVSTPLSPTSSLALIPFSNRCGTPQSTPFGAQCSCWHTVSCTPLIEVSTPYPLWGPASSLALVPFSNRCGTPQSTPFGAQRSCWHTASCPPPIEVSTLLSPLGPSILAGTRSLLQSIWDPPNLPPSGPNVLTGTPPCIHLLRDSTSSLTHHPFYLCICNSPSPLLVNLVLFVLPLPVSPQGF